MLEAYQSGRNEPHSKCGCRSDPARGFESLRFRQKIAVHCCTAICIFNKQRGIYDRTFWGKIKRSYSTTSHP